LVFNIFVFFEQTPKDVRKEYDHFAISIIALSSWPAINLTPYGDSLWYHEDMRIPNSGKKKALIVVDMQPAFIQPHNKHIVSNTAVLLQKVSYAAYVEAVFSAEKGSIWDEQQEWICPKNTDTRTVDEVKALLADKSPLRVDKQTRSVFQGNKEVVTWLKEKGIEEVHLVGTETNDCVMATAFDAFDAGFLTYIIEECCESATEGRHQMGVDILRLQGMTNNRCLVNTIDIPLS
jgi:nicotinamidase-related amidase